MYIIILALVLFFGFITSYQDFKHKKVKNKILLYMFCIGFILNFFEAFTISPILLLYSFSNLFFSFLICFSLWAMGVLSGGDAKLIIAFSYLIPPSLYNYVYFQIYPAFSLLINIFVPASLILLVLAFFRIRKNCLRIAKETFNKKVFTFTFIFVVSFLGVTEILLQIIQISSNFIIQSLLLFFIFYILRILNINVLKISSIVLFILIIFFPETIISLDYLASVIYTMIYILFFSFILTVADKAYSQEIKIEYLKPGMKLSEILIKEKEKYRKENFTLRFFYDFLFLSEKRIKGGSVSINEKIINELKKLKKDGKLNFDKIKISTTINFAPFISFGAFLTILFKGLSIVEILQKFFNFL